jgi:RNA polymerase sigma-70 factor (ECF subfamily)
MTEESDLALQSGLAPPAVEEAPPLEALVQQAQSGDAYAFGLLYERLLDRVYRYFVYHTHDPVLAEDLTEEVFLRAWQALPRYEERGIPFIAWVFRLARNLLVDHARRAKVRQASLQRLRVAPPDGPEELAVQWEQLQAVREALQGLSQDHRQVIFLRLIEGYSTPEVAAMMDRSEPAVRALLYRALQALRSALR